MNGQMKGKGTQASPYIIEDIWDFNNIRIFPKACYILNNNIDFGVPPFDSGFVPINNFTGQLDGQGYKLINIKINQPDLENVGIFSYISFNCNSYNSTNMPYIKNLVIENADVVGKTNVGILIGKMIYNYNINAHNYLGSIYLDNIYISGRAKGRNHLGSVIGYLQFTHNNYNTLFSSNLHINTALTPSNSNTYVSPIYGYVYSNNLNYTNTVTIIKDSLIQVELDSTVVYNTAYVTNFFNSNVIFSSAYKYKIYNCIYDEMWNSYQSPFVKLISKDIYGISANISDWTNELEVPEKWKCNYNTLPYLNILMANHYEILIRYNDNEYLGKDLFPVKLYNYQSIKEQGINQSDINEQFFKRLYEKIGHSNFDVVVISSTSRGIVLSDEKIFKLHEDESKKSSHIIYRNKFNFNDIPVNSELFKMIGK